MACGKFDRKALYINRLEVLGRSLHQEQQLSVFHRGFVGLDHEDESEVKKYVKGTARRSAARSGAGQSAAQRTWRRASSETNQFRTAAVEAAFGTEFRILAQHYPVLGFEEEAGLWAVVESYPLGSHGPQIDFVIALRSDRKAHPKAWAFRSVGRQKRLMPLKHTNFPDASICAFPQDDGSWSWEDGITALVDHYTIWAVKSLHKEQFGWWPGRQHGVCALYRRREFVPNEACGCGSGKSYGVCHQTRDFLVSESFARQEFRQLFRCDYEGRRPPVAVEQAAAAYWATMPSMALLI